jgi:hypothetical protein
VRRLTFLCSKWNVCLVFYMADGFKMDYGGHDSVFEKNLIISYRKYSVSATMGSCP